jgi:hypothetical protein
MGIGEKVIFVLIRTRTEDSITEETKRFCQEPCSFKI